MSNIAKIAGVFCLVSCAHAAEHLAEEPHSPAIAHYTVTIFDKLGGARVLACFDEMAPSALVPMEKSAGSRLRGAWIDGTPLETRDGRILLRRQRTGECVEYETQFAQTRFGLGDSSAAVLSQSQWLWRPDPFPNEVSTTVRFVVPGDGRVSLSWPQSDGVYQPNQNIFFEKTFGVFGTFEQHLFSVANTRIEVARLGATPLEGEVRRWLSRAVEATASVGGRFPRDDLQFVIVPVDAAGASVAFGMVRRGGGASILLLPSVDAEVAELEADWVAVHELSHLWLPRLRPNDRWLSEGIATYLQEVLRARCGLQSSDRTWRRLREGFERGRRSGSGRQLADESGSMNQTGAYHRVYWAGAAFALDTDLRLRRQSGGKRTLLSVLNDAQRTWEEEAHSVGASRVLAALEQASGAKFIVALGKQYAQRSGFPDTSYLDSPEYDDLRKQISAPAHGGCVLSGESSR